MKKILLADDNVTDRVLYRRLLGKQLGHESVEFYEATSGAEAVSLFAQVRPDCVVLDYNLHDMDGLLVLAQLQQLTHTDTLCVVMITGSGNEALAVRALNGGASDYLVKGQFDQTLLARIILHAIEKNEWRQYQARYHQELQVMNQQLRESLSELTETRGQLQARNQELATINQKLARTNADLDNFVYAASHDLRQPVHNLQGLFEELRRSATFHDPEEAHVLRLVDSSLNALVTTITDLATVVQEQRSTGTQSTESVTMQDVAEEVCQSLCPQVQASAARITTDFAELPEVEYVRSNLRTILLNLLSNAIKYRHPSRPSRIVVRTRQHHGQPVLEVQDNGLGLDMARHGPDLFQLFRRFHPGVEDGTGVGLFLVNRLAQTAGGRVEVESEEGTGATFRVYLRG